MRNPKPVLYIIDIRKDLLRQYPNIIAQTDTPGNLAPTKKACVNVSTAVPVYTYRLTLPPRKYAVVRRGHLGIGFVMVSFVRNCKGPDFRTRLTPKLLLFMHPPPPRNNQTTFTFQCKYREKALLGSTSQNMLQLRVLPINYCTPE